MTENTVIDLTKPGDFSSDPLTDVLHQGARDILAAALQAEVSAFVAGHAHLLDEVGRHRLVRHGFLPAREVMTIAWQAIAKQSAEKGGIGKVPVQVPRVRDRATAKGAGKIRFRSALIPPYLRKSTFGRRGADEYGDKHVPGIMDGFRAMVP